MQTAILTLWPTTNLESLFNFSSTSLDCRIKQLYTREVMQAWLQPCGRFEAGTLFLSNLTRSHSATYTQI